MKESVRRESMGRESGVKERERAWVKKWGEKVGRERFWDEGGSGESVGERESGMRKRLEKIEVREKEGLQQEA